LFAFSQKAGLPLWLPKGAALRDVCKFEKKQKKGGYEQVAPTYWSKEYM
jgi:threonyl-tRNA synthetase